MWKEAEESRLLKKRKRRLISVGLRPEEKAYLTIRKSLTKEYERWSAKEEKEKEILKELESRYQNLKRDKSNSTEALDLVQAGVPRCLEGTPFSAAKHDAVSALVFFPFFF